MFHFKHDVFVNCYLKYDGSYKDKYS
jgi:hypothetical protein